jgi:putative SOS response-associated peptidase YedK
MPVLLTTEAEHEQWLSGTPSEALSLIRSFDADQMRIVQKGAEKEDLLAA